MEEMKFLFTPEGFIPDITDDSPVEIKNEAFAWKGEGAYNKLYEFGAGPRPEHLTPSASYLYTVSSSFFKALTELPELEVAREKAKVKLSQEQMDYLLDAVPFGLGAENITAQWIKNIYKRFQKHYKEEIKAYPGTVEMYLSEKNQDLHVPERIFFHLVEQNKDPEFPFAFMATYASRGTDGKVHHYPLRYALTEYKAERRKLLELLSCLNKAAEVSELIADFMKNGELFHPLRLTAQEAFAFLKDIDEIEKTGILCRIPNWWRRKVMNPALNIKIGAGAPSLLGFDSILETSPSLTIDGVELTEEDIRDLLNMTEGLAMLKGKWIVVDHARLKDLLKRMDQRRSVISDDSRALKSNDYDEQTDTGGDTVFQVRGYGVNKSLTEFEDREDNEDNTFDQDRGQRDLPRILDSLRGDGGNYGEREIRVQAHTGSQSYRIVSEKTHQNAGKSSGYSGRGKDRTLIHARGRKDTRVNGQNIRHRKECRKSGNDLGPCCRVVFLELKEVLQEIHAPILN